MPTPATPWEPQLHPYPPARRSDHVDVYKSEAKGEVKIPDPYQWLEVDSEETDQWTTAQEKFTREYLDKNPEREELEEAIRKTTDYAKFSAPSLKDDGRWYWYYNTGLQAQLVLYRSKDSVLPDVSEGGAGGEVFFDCNLLSDDGTSALSVTAFSSSGEYFAYAVSVSGSDLNTVYVCPVTAPLVAVEGQKVSHHDGRLPDEVRFVKFSSITWTKDSKGFFYQRFPGEAKGDAEATGIQTGSDANAKIYYHRIGTLQSEDILVLENEAHPEYIYGAELTELDGRYLLGTAAKDTSRKHLLWIADLKEGPIGPNMKWDKLIDDFVARYDYIANNGTVFYFLTNYDAPQFKLVSVDISSPPSERVWKDVVPEDKGAALNEVLAISGDRFVLVYKRNVKDEIYLYDFNGTRLTRLAPDFVGAAELSGRRDRDKFFATLTGFTSPSTLGLYDSTIPLLPPSALPNSAGEEVVGTEGGRHDQRWRYYRTTKVDGLKLDEFEASQVWYESVDGAKVPMFIVKHRDTKFDGTAPAIQYGYGGFTISINPFFSPSILTFIQKYGGILAVPNIRGGGEFGDNWHRAAIREKKKNSYDDFISATKFLVDNKYTAPGKVAIQGSSNGGLLVAACLERAPEGLIGAAVADVGVHDLLKFADFTIGRAWTSDFGNPHDPHDFDFIYPISPVHNVPKDKVLPPTILLTADHDDRVVPMHTFKFAATLQHTLPNNPHPLLVRVDKKAGHGSGKSTDQKIKEAADKWGFVAQALGLPAKSNVEPSGKL